MIVPIRPKPNNMKGTNLIKIRTSFPTSCELCRLQAGAGCCLMQNAELSSLFVIESLNSWNAFLFRILSCHKTRSLLSINLAFCLPLHKNCFCPATAKANNAWALLSFIVLILRSSCEMTHRNSLPVLLIVALC